jgi:hypothetical protein
LTVWKTQPWTGPLIGFPAGAADAAEAADATPALPTPIAITAAAMPPMRPTLFLMLIS